MRIVSTLFFLFVSVIFYSKGFGQPKIKLIEAYKDIGIYSFDIKSVDFELLYTNIGDSPLYLTETKVFCPCIETEISTEALVPGDTASIKVHYTFKQIGDFSNPIRIYYNSEDPELFYTATFFGEVIEKKEVDNEE